MLVEDEEPSYWWLSQEYVGPDGVARTREGFVAALRTEPYENRVILPHERTHAGPKEGRLRLLEATHPARADLPALGRLDRARRARRAGPHRGGGRRHRTALAARRRLRRRPHRGARGRPAADRRRPPPLRDDARLPRARRLGGERVDDGRDRPHRPGGPDDLPDASRRAVGERRQRHADRRARRRASRPRALPRRHATSCSRATGSIRRSSTRSRRRASPTRRTRARRSPPSTAARRRPRSCCARRASRTCGRSPAAAT